MGADVKKEGNQLTSVSGYAVKEMLGKGAFGEVFLGRKGGESYAIKVLHKKVLKGKRQGKHGSAFDSVRSEIATMRKMQHPNLVHMFDVIIDLEQEDIFLVLEYVDGGTSQPNDSNGNPVMLPEKTIWSYTRHLVLGLEYLHMNGIVHRDIKPENLLLTKGTWAMLKIADFGTSCLCEGDANAQKTAGTPMFFSPELCSKDASGKYDGRAVDLWACGVTLYLWATGKLPFVAPTVMLLMQSITNAPEKVAAPKGMSSLLSQVTEGLLTKDPASRLTLNQLRLHTWLTAGNRQPLPNQSLELIELTAEEIEQAFSNRAAIAYQSAAGPSALGKATGYRADWKREGLSTIRKRSNAAEATIYQAISSDGHLSHHVPLIYSVKELGMRTTSNEYSSINTDESFHQDDEIFEVRMQDLAAGMTRPCAMAMVMGTRTLIPTDLLKGNAAGREELERLDHATSTATLGFRIDAARTVVGRELDTLPLPGNTTLDTLKEEDDIIKALGNFFQHDNNVCKAALMKLESIAGAIERSAFAAKHVLLRSSLLMLFDDAARDKIEIKMINFGASYALPEGSPPAGHTAAWDGTATSHEDGYLTGVRSLARLIKRFEIEQAAENRASIAYQSAAGPSALGKATGYIPNWKREGASTIRKVSNEAEATIYRTITEDAYLHHHVPAINSVTPIEREEGIEIEMSHRFTSNPAAALAKKEKDAEGGVQPSDGGAEAFEVRMQDLAAGMTRPCAMGLVMGCRTIIPTGTAQENLEHLDHMTSTATLGFRIDAARTVVNGALEALPLPDDKTLDTLKEEDDIIKALGTFFQHDTNVCKAALMKLESIAGAIERSAFAAKHVLLRSSLLMLFDDDKRDHVELKMINFGFSYALPEGSPPAGHTAAWDGTATSHEDGYLTGARSLVRLMKRLHKDLEIRM